MLSFIFFFDFTKKFNFLIEKLYCMIFFSNNPELNSYTHCAYSKPSEPKKQQHNKVTPRLNRYVLKQYRRL